MRALLLSAVLLVCTSTFAAEYPTYSCSVFRTEGTGKYCGTVTVTADRGTQLLKDCGLAVDSREVGGPAMGVILATTARNGTRLTHQATLLIYPSDAPNRFGLSIAPASHGFALGEMNCTAVKRP